MSARVLLRTAVLGAAASCALAPGATPAAAYVRYRTSEGNPFSWRTPTVAITAYPIGLPSVPLAQITDAVTKSVNAWTAQDPTIALCGYLELPLTFAGLTTPGPEAKYDHQNIIVFRNTNWEQICPPDSNGTPVCHVYGQIAVTTIFSRGCGETVDADVEMNAWDNTFGDLDFAPSTGSTQDIQNALTHEMGHFIGLDHSCYINDTPYLDANGKLDPPLDSNGVPMSSCDQATPDEVASTMFPEADPGDLTKRSLTPDDQKAVCDIYPIGTTPQSCGDGTAATGGCAVGAGDAVESRVASGLGAPGAAGASRRRGWLIVGLVGGLAVMISARRARRGRRP